MLRAALLLAVLQPAWGASDTADATFIGLDHIPVVVSNLSEASEAYRRLGFSIKPGRVHEGGMVNAHVKFVDGSGIELVYPPDAAAQGISRVYGDHLRNGEGPVYLALHARDTERLTVALGESGFDSKRSGAVTTLEDPALDFLFFVRDNRSPTDTPDHLTHDNSAYQLSGVWLALSDVSRDRLRELLTALGVAREMVRPVFPSVATAESFILTNGRVVLIPEEHQLHPGRPLVGAEFLVRDLEAFLRLPDARYNSEENLILLEPGDHGKFWLRFYIPEP